ncbi:MlaC/ttg2D family ABC transporter substrate-binding protein [Xanthomonas oryzae]|uniref:Toluene tolerance protein n=26 Tax=Xanthomonas oryzae TaxID=347 RepID=Q5H659_XANOR|nr:ABC transporter substrate-binding protein [Xanthomonas oryzae]AAW73561.1 toluene tolerance protein [Xanthomonas oryzae pv. oryzae KACC 10331]ACD61485.1 toluene tolerance protein Ttg2D [Xanthomonas oryzae pv. oryzae PXO99A]AJQ85194.1 organic solvent ABC transporter [Xanthomonas oryzae pv. oryzae PXO86]ALZ73765.1 organic solvent ABC transporter [Xanthomonas oryzae pv. oryzae]AOS00908.1 organic solvent ABC transporter [Xanthomonas oryzae pv. oryzae]
MKTTLLSAVLASTLLVCAPATVLAQPAAASAPTQGAATKTVIDSSTRILSTLDQRRAEFRSNPAALRQFINGELNQAFDRDYSARLVLGVHGRGASDADVKLFADALADNLMQRYGTALLNFEGKPTFRAKSESALPGNRGVKVSTDLLRAGNDPTPVDYLMRNTGGQWKIFDVMIEGISYVQTFKTQFDGPLREKGIAKVAAELRTGNLQVGAAPANGN